MTREYKMVIKQVGINAYDIHCATREDNGAWKNQGIIPVIGTIEEIKTQRIANQEKWGWTLYDIETENTLIFWKEF